MALHNIYSSAGLTRLRPCTTRSPTPRRVRPRAARCPAHTRPRYVPFFSSASFLLPLTPVLLPPLLLVGRDRIRCRCGRGRTDVARVLYGRAHGRRGCGHVRGHGRPRPWPWF